ncbi:MAG: SRPBCC family protein [bacterium]
MTKYDTGVERKSDLELVVTRRFDAPARLVFKAWTTPELMMQWWVPKSFPMTFISCEMDARTGGSYRFVFGHPDFDQPMAFFGKYLEVIADQRIVWTNAESDDGSVSTLTFTDDTGGCLQVLHDLYPTKEAADEAIASGSTSGYPEQFSALDALVAELGQDPVDQG